MNYSELPLEEKNKKAIEYALILAADDRPDLDIISELMDMFGYSEEDADKVYILMRKQNDKEYRKAVSQSIKNLWIAIIGCGIIMFAFLFLSAISIAIFLISAFLWGITLLTCAHFLALKYRDIRTPPEDGYFRLKAETGDNLKENSKNKINWFIDVPIVLLFLATVSFYAFYYNDGSFNVIKIINPAKPMVVQNVKLIRTGGKVKHYEMEFRFLNSPHRFMFNENIYKYGDWQVHSQQFSYGDTLLIALMEKAYSKMKQEKEKKIDVINIKVKGKWLVDHVKRNAAIQKDNKNYLILFSGLFLLSIIITGMWLRYKKYGTKIQQVPF